MLTMRRVYTAALAAIAATTASAQTSASSSSISSSHSTTTAAASMSYMTDYYDECDTTESSSEMIITNTETLTHCPGCGTMGTMSTSSGHYTTTYETVYSSLCPTGGFENHTYTITETCSEKPTGSDRPATIPSGFAVTVTTCTMCGPSPITATLTVCTACNGSMGPTPNSGGNSAPGGSMTGSMPMPTAPSTEDKSITTSTSTSCPSSTATMVSVPGVAYSSGRMTYPSPAPACGTSPCPSRALPAPSASYTPPSSPPIVPFTGNASSIGMSLAGGLMVIIVGIALYL